MRANYHTHTTYSDGQVSVEEIVECAIGNNFDIIGLSDHSPVHFRSKWNMQFEKISDYLDDIYKAKQKYKDKILVLAGMEIDYFKGLTNIEYYKKYGLDYTIGSVHYLGKFPHGKPFNLDKSADEFLKGLEIIFNDQPYELASAYYHQVIRMILNDKPDIIAHLTLIEKFNKKLRKIDTEADWYKELIYITLDIIQQTDCILEINARSWYRGLLDEFVPPLWVLKEARKRNIPITISGDIHKPQEFGMYWDDAIEFAKAAGYKQYTIILEKGERQTVKID